MHQKSFASVCCLVGAALLGGGCVSTSSERTSPWKLPASLASSLTTKSSETTTPQGGTNDDELPTRETVKACLTTAEQLEQQGHFREARLLFEKARSLDPKAAPYARRIATLHEREGDFARALVEYRAALEATPRDADLWNDFGYLHFRQGAWQEAEKHFRHALSLAPNDPRATTNLGQALAQQQRYAEAYDTFVAVVGPAAAHSNVGAIMAKQGRHDEARQAFRKALALNADLPQARALLAHLEQQTPSRNPAGPVVPETRLAN